MDRTLYTLVVLAAALIFLPNLSYVASVRPPALQGRTVSTLEAFLGPLNVGQDPQVVFGDKGAEIKMKFLGSSLESFFQCMCSNTTIECQIEYFKHTDEDSHPIAMAVTQIQYDVDARVGRSQNVVFRCSGYNAHVHLGAINCRREQVAEPANESDFAPTMPEVCDFRCITVVWEEEFEFVNFGHPAFAKPGQFCLGSYYTGDWPTAAAFVGPLDEVRKPEVVFYRKGTEMKMSFSPKTLESLFQCMCINTTEECRVEYFRHTDKDAHPVVMAVTQIDFKTSAEVHHTYDVTYKCSDLNTHSNLGAMNCRRELIGDSHTGSSLGDYQPNVCAFKCITLEWEDGFKLANFGWQSASKTPGRFCLY